MRIIFYKKFARASHLRASIPIKILPILQTLVTEEIYLPQLLRISNWNYVNTCNLLSLAYNVGSKENLNTTPSNITKQKWLKIRYTQVSNAACMLVSVSSPAVQSELGILQIGLFSIKCMRLVCLFFRERWKTKEIFDVQILPHCCCIIWSNKNTTIFLWNYGHLSATVAWVVNSMTFHI